MKLFWIMIRLWLDLHIYPGWMQDRTPDARHPYGRLFTRKHRDKRKIVKKIWIGAGLIVLANPFLHVMLVVVLPVTFLSFAILDESP